MTPLIADGERYHPEQQGSVRSEHLHRYLAATALVRDRDVLDIACGEGYGSALLAAAARSVVGVDISPAAVAHAEAVYPHERLRFALGSTSAIPLADDAVDIVVSFETLEHVDDQLTMLAEIRRVLRPAGLLVISTPNLPVYNASIVQPNPYHVSELDLIAFESLLRRTFSAVRIYGQGMIAGSLLVPLANAADDLHVCGVCDPGAPMYALAVCGADDETLPRLDASLYVEGGFAQHATLTAEVATARLALEAVAADDASARARLVRMRGGDALAGAAFAACSEEQTAAIGVADRWGDAPLAAAHAFALQGTPATVSGWCLFADERAADAVVVTVAGRVVASARGARSDLADRFGPAADGAGFEAALPADLPPGFHAVHVWALDLGANARRRVSSFEMIVMPRPAAAHETPLLWIDRLELLAANGDASLAPTVLHAQGWAIDAKRRPFRTVALVIDDALLVPLAYGDERVDVAAQFGLDDVGLGWHGTVALSAGEHTVALVGLGAAGGEAGSDTRTLRVRS